MLQADLMKTTRMTSFVLLLAGLFVMSGCQHLSTSASEMDAGWRSLFDGKTFAGWRGYKQTIVPPGWSVDEGTLHFVPGQQKHVPKDKKKKGGPSGDLITIEKYANYELVLEWKVKPGANSGVLLRASEEGEKIWHTAMEIQVIDGTGYEKPLGALHNAGALYALYPAVPESIKPAGEWNQLRVLADGKDITVWQNGTEVCSFTIGSKDWNKRFEESKFKKFPEVGQIAKGHIGLQSHGGEVWYRNLKIKALRR